MKRAHPAHLVPVLMLALLVACAPHGRPSQTEMATAIEADNNILGLGKVSSQRAHCVARILYDSKLSDPTLQAIIDADRNYANNDTDAKIMIGLGAKIAECPTT